MKAVILAAGRGKRMGDLTSTLPKPLIEVGNKTLIEHKLDILPPVIDEVIIVVGYLGEQIIELIGDFYNGKKITYVWQKELKGTGHALWQAREHLQERFLVMMGDDIYSERDILECLRHDWSILVKEEFGQARGGRIVMDNGKVLNIIEGEHSGDRMFISAALYVLGPKIFNYALVKLPDREEWGLPQTLAQASEDVDLKVVVSNFWLQLTDSRDVEVARDSLLFRGTDLGFRG